MQNNAPRRGRETEGAGQFQPLDNGMMANILVTRLIQPPKGSASSIPTCQTNFASGDVKKAIGPNHLKAAAPLSKYSVAARTVLTGFRLDKTKATVIQFASPP